MDSNLFSHTNAPLSLLLTVEYVFVAQHRENWANTGALKDSLADVSYFALELTKRMEMRYVAPPMPINLNRTTNSSSGGGGNNNDDNTSWANLQRQMAAQVMGQSDRLDNTNTSTNSQHLVPALSSTRPPSTQSEYDFTDIEAMFEKNK